MIFVCLFVVDLSFGPNVIEVGAVRRLLSVGKIEVTAAELLASKRDGPFLDKILPL